MKPIGAIRDLKAHMYNTKLLDEVDPKDLEKLCKGVSHDKVKKNLLKNLEINY